LLLPAFSFGIKSFKRQHMKRILTMTGALLMIVLVHAQQKEGKVIYDRTVQMQVSFAGMNEEMQRMIPKSRTDKFELSFGNNQSLWRQAEQEDDGETSFGGEGGGMQIRMVAGGSNDVVYNNFETGKKVEKREMFDKTFIIDDSTRPLKWKMTGETKTILGHACMKATTTNISGPRMRMTMEDGKMERKEVIDTSNIVAWFASDIPVPAGPAEYQGTLPGLVLEMDINEGRQVFKATEILTKVDVASIKEPTGKKRYSAEEFRKERDKMLEEMQKNNTGGGRRIIMN
jgi:GLPGLI family protein